MKDRLKAARDAAAELAEKAQRLLPGGSSDDDIEVEVVDNLAVEDDEDDEELPSLEEHLMTVEKIGGAREMAGNVLIGVKRWGRDIEFTGVLLQMAFMAPGLAEAVEQEARLRGIPVEVIETEN